MPGFPSAARTGRTRPPARRAAARVVAVAALALAAAILLHPVIPGAVGTAIATVLPWLGLVVLALLVVALLTRRRVWIVTLVPLVAWLALVAPLAVPLQDVPAAQAGEYSMTVASQNVEAGSGGAAESALTLAAQDADVIALEEMDGAARAEVREAIDGDYPYLYTVGTVGLWSRYPIVNEQPLELGLGWNRALAADLETPSGLVSIYVVHAASLRPGAQSDRDGMLARLAEIVAQDENERVLVVGDFNATVTDPAMRALQRTVREPNQSKASLGFTWPSTAPIARIDHIFQAGLTPLESSVLQAGNSDHRAVLSRFGF
ncbi:endonuclease/exonuclease/phosphatase family protein [Microterricola viridarii]|uniref:Endonuclease/exonuclease/phosphatase domain-containing protein n=1 Tax=Microterricola viridarii TaxID=412690 RepID=A0A109QWP6_9MICO|nr:endonuclease/exonuclease/phosphatase family protein [Microterricola viridarii]AMB58457.1 hypothetical protein AWU67_05855 [Microterricola viridarii]